MSSVRTPRVQFQEFDDFDYVASTLDPGRLAGVTPSLHTHLSAQLLVIEGEIEFSWLASQVRLRDAAVMFFCAFPHGIETASPGAVVRTTQVPIVDVLSWPLPAGSADRILRGELLRDSISIRQRNDALSFARWETELASGDPAVRETSKLEIEARMRRLLAGALPIGAETPRSTTSLGVVEAVHFVARNFSAPISVNDIAAAVGWHRDHLMASFRTTCGISLWQFVTRIRLSEARRLLVTTDLPVQTVCRRAGFNSTVRMYDAFHRHLGTTPARYRRDLER